MIEVALYGYFLVTPIATLWAILWIDRQTKTQFNETQKQENKKGKLKQKLND